MIIANQEIAVHLKLVRNLTGLTSGRFFARISLVQLNCGKKIIATPFNVVQRDPLKHQNRSELDDHYYSTRTFFLKSGMNVELDEICIFKLNSPLFNGGEEQRILNLFCELIYVQQQGSRVIDVSKMRIAGYAFHEYLEMNFYELAPCQVVGTIHSCIYKFQFIGGKNNAIDLKTYVEQYSKFRIDEIADYLSTEGRNCFQVVSSMYERLAGKPAEVTCIFPQVKEEKQAQKEDDERLGQKKEENKEENKAKDPINKVGKIQEKDEVKEGVGIKMHKAITLQLGAKTRSRKKLFSNDTMKTEGDEERLEADPSFGQKPKRRKIFNTTSKELQSQKILEKERLLHANAQKIYQIWREVLGFIFEEAGKKFFNSKCLDYQKKTKEKVGESVVRFKGSRDVDLYGNEEEMRNKLAYQLRNQNKQYFKDYKSMTQSIFPILDQRFFSPERPIFFEQFAQPIQALNGEGYPKEILVIMVHGLGACRLDMEKIKSELRRYYDFRVKVYISSANEARTEGNIDDMGVRLANEVDYQLSKYTQIPKICFLGHSMGGIIIRSALPRLEKYKSRFHALITLSSPHIGYTYSTSALIDAGLWFINAMKKCTSIEQLTMVDSEDPKETFLYKLSLQPGLEWFSRLVFLASHQDLYVPYYSARIQKSEESLLDERNQVAKGQLHCTMIDNLLSKFKGEIIRVDVNFCIPEQNIDNLIGRAAHISFINSVEMVRTFVVAGPHYFF